MKPFIIELPKFLNQVTIERLLKSNFLNSSRKHKVVTFDMKKIVWSSPYCLSLLFLWAKKISGLNKVEIKSPGLDSNGEVPEKSKGIIGFLGSWGYWDALARNGIELDVTEKELLYRDRLADFSAKCVPFQFFNDHNSLNSYIEQLDLSSKIDSVLDSSVNIDAIGLKGLRSIIIQELGNNAFDHGGGKSTHLTIGVTPKVEANNRQELTEKLIKRLQAVPRYMVTFYRALKNYQCLEIVISDLGDGIFKTLKEAFVDDEIIQEKTKNNVTEHTILKYAYLLHSTSKKEKWDFKVDTGRDETDYKPPRGLYFVKNIVRRNKGLLLCRSGQSIISFDFLSSPVGKFNTNLADKRFEKLTNLGGTQLHILIPLIGKKEKFQIPISIRGLEKDGDTLPTVHILLKSFFITAQPNEIVKNIVKTIHRIAINSGKNNLFIVDFIGTRWKKETIFPVISEILYLGLDSYKFVAINVDDDFDDYLELYSHGKNGNNLSIEGQTWNKQRPFIIFNNKNNTLYLSKFYDTKKVDVDGIFIDILSKKSLDVSAIPEFLDHLIAVQGDKPILTFSAKSLIDSINDIQTKTLEQIIQNPEDGIKHQGKFLFPTLTYSETFYEVGAFFENNWKKDLLKNVLSVVITQDDLKKNTLLSISKIGQKLGGLLENSFKGPSQNIFHINTSKPDIKLSKLYKLPAEKKIILLVDVIATGKSLLNIIDRLTRFKIFNKILKIVCIVDIRDEVVATSELNTPNGKIKINTLVKVPTRLYADKRPADWSWSEIQRIDSDTWRIIQNELFPSHLWLTSDEKFISSVINYANGIEEGHFYNKENEKHYSYFFLTKNICNKFGPEISKAIINHSKELSENRATHKKISHILLSGQTYGLDQVIETIVAETGAKPIRIEHLNNLSSIDLHNEKVEGVIIVDSAITTGETIWSLLDIATASNAKAIYIYIIMNRASNKTALRFRKLERYNKADVSIDQVVSLPILAFKTKECPICERIYLLNELKTLDCLSFIKNTIDDEITLLTKSPIKNFIENSNMKYEYNKKALEKRVTLRIKIQKFIDGDRLAWMDILDIFASDKIDDFAATALVEVLFNEVQLFSKLHQGFPPEFREKLFDYCMLLIKRNEQWRIGLGVAAAFRLDLLIKNSNEISDSLINVPNGFEILIIELMFHKNLTQSEKLLDCFISLKEKYSKNLNYELTLTLDKMTNYFNNEIVRDLDKEDKPIYHFTEISKALFLKREHELHDRLREVWPFVSAITPEKIYEIIEQHYFGEYGFDSLVRKCILPNLLAIKDLFGSVISDYFPYLETQFNDDIELLNSKLFKIYIQKKKKNLSDNDFRKIWEDERLKKAKKRIHDCIIAPDGIFKKFILSQFCYGDSILEDLSEYWKNEFVEKKIHFECTLNANNTETFCFKDSFASVLNNFFSNAWKYSFPNGVDMQSKFEIKTETNKSNYKIIISENGVGLSENNTNQIKERLLPICKSYGIKIDITSSPGKTKIELNFLKKGELI